MGLFVLHLASSKEMTSGPGFQVAFGKRLASFFGWVEKVTSPVPEALLGLVVLALAGVFVYATLRDRTSRSQRPLAPEDDPECDAAPSNDQDTVEQPSIHT